ncbi:MAG: ligase-associated DNA damage response endonuclease PdeM [Bacteroidia bacterium]|nr:ligase-associated DNA damage response endonuclease PdeM [Bacteroidia bacterium]
MNSKIEITLQGETLQLLSERAIWWPEQGALLLADLHLGKSGHFRSHGIAIPNQVNANTLQRFEKLVSTYQPRKVIFLGDLFHSRYNKEWEAFCASLNRNKTRNILIKGNHDILTAEHYAQAKMEVFEHCYSLGPFTLCHEPLDQKIEGKYSLSAHIHPGVRLVGSGRQKLSLPCFFFGEQEGILPAFGSFTGLYMMDATEAKAIFAIVEEQVIQVHGEKMEG